jgi:O-antigen polysaccharide polymerase Wzy-like protein
VTSSPGDGLGVTEPDVARDHLRITIAMLAVAPTIWLGWLVLHQQPLPISDIGTAGLVTTGFCLIASVLVLVVHRLPLLSFPAALLGATFLFTCSPLMLYQVQGAQAFDSWEIVDIHAVVQAMPVVMLAFSSFVVGSMITRRRPHADPYTPGPDTPLDDRARVMRQLAIAMYAITVLFVIVFTLQGGALTFAFQGGHQGFHGAKRVGQVSSLVGASTSRLMPWSLLILAATSRDRRSRMITTALAVPFVVMMFSTGDRGNALAAMVTIAAGLYLVGARISWRRAIALIALIAFLIPTILNLRRVPVSDWSMQAFTAAATNEVNGTPVYGQTIVGGFLLAMSAPYQTLMATVGAVPSQEDYHAGSDYLESLIVAVPFRSGLLARLGVDIRQLPPSQWVLQYLHPGRTAGPGYLQLAEAYLQFGALGVIGLYVLLGWGVTHLWWYVSDRRWKPQTVAFALIAMAEMLIWVRNSSTLEVRALTWGAIIVYVVPALLTVRRHRRAPAVEPAFGRSVLQP